MNMLKKKCYQGFTTKELLYVIIVVGILCSVSVPIFHWLQDSFKETALQAVLKNIQEEIGRIKQSGGTLPTTLDNEPTQQKCTNCFSLLLSKGLNNKMWYKNSENVYLYSRDGNHERVTDLELIYDATHGVLVKNVEKKIKTPSR